MNETNMIKAENTIKNDKSSTEFTILKMEINNLKKEMKDKETAYQNEIKLIRQEKNKEIDKYIKNSTEIVEKNANESTKYNEL